MGRDLGDLLGADEGIVLETRQHWFVVVRQIVVRLLILIVIAVLYDLYAVLGGSTGALLAELLPTAAFIGVAVLGFRTSLWWVVAGLIGHGVYDILHPTIFVNPGVPAWWPAFCLAYDVAAGGFLAWRLLGNRKLSAGFP